MKRFKLPCGDKLIPIDLPDSATILEGSQPPPMENPQEKVEKLLKAPLDAPPLSILAKGKKTATIVVSDVTRPVPNKIILPPLLSAIEGAGLKKEDITILIATGMHRPNLGEELEGLIGREVASKYRVINHDCRDRKSIEKIAEIEGNPIEINKIYLEADLKILTGLIEPHFYAGYSGGRKSILPGISSFETMKFMHSFKMIDHPKVTNCLLQGNPFHEYGLAVAEKAGIDFIINAVVDKEKRPAGFFAGHFDSAHIEGCEMVGKYAVALLDEYQDLVITTGGGAPLDATFYQVAKGLVCAGDILKPGGTILIACGCSEGLGSPDFTSLIRRGLTPAEFNAEFSNPDNFIIDQWCAQNIQQVVDKAGRVLVFSPDLSTADIEAAGCEPVEDIQKTVNALMAKHEKAIVSPQGPYVVGAVTPS